MQYAKGIQAQETIFEIGKHLMYLHGYKKTTISMIAEEAQVPPGLVNYYYKKQDFVARIYGDFMDGIRECILSQTEEEPPNQLQMHILTTKIMLAHILSDERIKEFHLEIYRDNQLPAKIHERVRTMQIEIMKSYGLKLTSEYYYWCAAAEYGARRELIVQNRRLDAESIYFRDLTDLISTITMRIAGLDPVIIDENLEWANQVYQNLKFWHLHMMK